VILKQSDYPIVLFIGAHMRIEDKNKKKNHYFYCFFVLAISAGKKRYKTANLKKIRRHYNQDTLREHIIPDESNRFRYFYHIRRANGDALSSVSFS
jgi:arginine/lysine/ornithine decarboxylase